MANRDEYTQVLIPEKVVVSQERKAMPFKKSSSENYPSIHWLTVVSLFFTGVVAIAVTLAVVRYEVKVGEYEDRITELETDLNTFFQVLAEELDYDRDLHKNTTSKKVDDITEDESWKVLMKELEEKIYPQSAKPVQENVRHRRKRQTALDHIPRYPNVPDSFGPEVERTGEGVPIVDQSYQANSNIRGGGRGSSRIVAAQPTPDSEGLRLYEGLVETGGRNEPKSLDFSTNEGNPLLPHHKVSAAWSEKGASDSSRSSRIQLRSGDSGYDDVDRYGGPRFANELTYSRSSTSNRKPRPVRPTSPTNTVSRPGVGVGATYHRNSRVAATYNSGVENYGGRVSPTPTTTRRRRIHQGGQEEYPPLRRMGYGQGEVIARVIQDNEDHHYQPSQQQQRRFRVGGERKTGALRDQQQQKQYLSRRPVETFQRPATPVTENPAGYSERQGPLNVTINKSVPFGTYYSSSRGNWEVNTQPTRYRNRY